MENETPPCGVGAVSFLVDMALFFYLIIEDRLGFLLIQDHKAWILLQVNDTNDIICYHMADLGCLLLLLVWLDGCSCLCVLVSVFFTNRN